MQYRLLIGLEISSVRSKKQNTFVSTVKMRIEMIKVIEKEKIHDKGFLRLHLNCF
jgi:hypothetical protein